MNIFSFFRFKKKQPFIPTGQFIREIPTNGKALEIAQNKELTDTQSFSDLLSYFNHFPYREDLLLQSTNEYILAPKKSIYELSSLMGSIVRSLNDGNTQIIGFIQRMGLDRHKSYLFFTDKPSQEFNTMDDKTITQLVKWMQAILDYFEANKVSIDETHDKMCTVIHSKLAVFYDFFYYLLCLKANVLCDNLDSIAVQVTIEF
jgi:hypothetical protein